MSIRAHRAFGVLLVVLVSSMTANALADLQSSAAAMACCAKAKFECAALRAPDDCCRQMRHASGRTVPGTVSAIDWHHVATLLSVGPAPVVEFSAHLLLNPRPASTRPHDPPHLHQYNPLI